jgi:glutaredoxin
VCYDVYKDTLWSNPVSKRKEPALSQVTFYTKAGCHLCDEARDMLDDIAAETPYELTEIDIRGNLEIFEQYRYRIPVIIINNDILLEGRIEFRDLVQAFHQPS